MPRFWSTLSTIPISLALWISPIHAPVRPVVAGPGIPPAIHKPKTPPKATHRSRKTIAIPTKPKHSRRFRRRVGWLARIIQAEAGDQSFNARLAVGDVVLNRMRSGIFPDSIRGVILQAGQFSTVSFGTFFSAIPTTRDRQIARFALKGWNIVPHALYFFSLPLPAGSWMYGLPDCQAHDAMWFCAAPSSAS